MKRLTLLTVLLFVAFGSQAIGITIPKIEDAPKIDGNLDEAVWQKAVKVNLCGLKGKAISNQTDVYLAYDNQNLYVAFKCYESRMDKLKALWSHTEERDNSIWADDCVDLFIDPLSSGTGNYYQIIANPAGVLWDAKNGQTTWDAKINVATTKSEQFWIVEMSIAFLDFGWTPANGDVWRGNVCREEKFFKELSCLAPNCKSFMDAETFGEFQFGELEKDVSVSVESLASNGKDAVKVVVDNQTSRAESIRIKLDMSHDGSAFFGDTKKIVVPAGESKSIVIPYKTKSGEQTLALDLYSSSKKKQIYSNRFVFTPISRLKEGKSKRVWSVDDPLYEELFSDEPVGLAKEGIIYWAPARNAAALYKFAKQYGVSYRADGEYEIKSDLKLNSFINRTDLKYSVCKPSEFDRKHKTKEILLADWRKADVPRKGTFPFLLDPASRKYCLEDIKEALDEFSDIIWAVSPGDEIYNIMAKEGVSMFEEHKDSYPFIVEADKEIKAKFGGGKYGIPLSLNDNNPYRWIAYRSWLNEKFSDHLEDLYRTVKESHPEIHVISYDPLAYGSPYDYGKWKDKSDIVTHQLYPRRSSNRACFGYITKLLADISGSREVWPCVHVEHYAANFTQEEVLELVSQAFRNGATGIHYYPIDTPGRRAKKKYLYYDYYGAPDNWKLMEKLIKEISKMNRLEFPEPDCAILYSCDSYAGLGLGSGSIDAECAYTFLGPNAGSSFKFIDDNQVLRDEVELSNFKAIYVPFAKYQREAVANKLAAYVRNGGVLISGDSDIFSFDTVGNDISKYRKKIFGVEKKEAIQGGTIKYGNMNLPLYSQQANIALHGKSTVLAKFATGEPAISSHRYGKGRGIFFASNPFTIKGLSNPGWKSFFVEFQKSLGLKVNNDIWRFKFPESMISTTPLPEGKCLTENHILWDKFEPLDKCNLVTNGTYSYSLEPDMVADQGNGEISFAKGDLTDRRNAPAAGNVEMGQSNLNDWIVAYKTVEAFDLTFDFKKDYPIQKVSLFYSGQLPDVKLYGSSDGVTWRQLDSSIEKQGFTEDVIDVALEGSFGVCRYVKVEFGQRDQGDTLTLSEVEVWSK